MIDEETLRVAAENASLRSLREGAVVAALCLDAAVDVILDALDRLEPDQAQELLQSPNYLRLLQLRAGLVWA